MPYKLSHPSKLACLCLPHSLIHSHSYVYTQTRILSPFSFVLFFDTLNVEVLFSENSHRSMPCPLLWEVTLSTWKLGLRTWDHHQVSQIASQEKRMIPLVKVLFGCWYGLLLLSRLTTPIPRWEAPLIESELGWVSIPGLCHTLVRLTLTRIARPKVSMSSQLASQKQR